ncbi:MAG: hypothetical protein JWQ00_1570 [Noviherbaspirillum sp.]|jgi:hypothetical protein|nr:hypothetical protein [Noviherbaspirillum sp.]
MRPIKSSQHGIAIISILLTSVALLGVLGAVVALSRTNLSSPSTTSAYASAIVSQGNNLALAFQSMERNGIPATNISYNSVASGITDLLNPASVSLSPQTPPAQAFMTGVSGTWVFKSTTSSNATTTTPGVGTATINGIGTTSADFVFVVGDLTLAMCQEINRQLSGSTAIPAAVASGNYATWTTAATAVTAAMTTVAGITGRMQGCIATTDATAQYVYYVVAEPQ